MERLKSAKLALSTFKEIIELQNPSKIKRDAGFSGLNTPLRLAGTAAFALYNDTQGGK